MDVGCYAIHGLKPADLGGGEPPASVTAVERSALVAWTSNQNHQVSLRSCGAVQVELRVRRWTSP